MTIFIALITLSCTETSRPSSAQHNVVLLDEEFIIQGLNRERQIRIYLPINYSNSQKRYSVIYMHDAQNLFDDSTSYAGEWGIDETLNEVSEDSLLNVIVVGIDNGQEKRWTELSPWDNIDHGRAEGVEYVDFIVKQLKPFIDDNYRTLTDRENTAIMGSSMGGLISHYSICTYPEVFGKAAILSPSYWYSDSVYKYVQEHPSDHSAKLFFAVGGSEGEMVSDTQAMYKAILESGHPKENIALMIDPEGSHNEESWGRQFLSAINWFVIK